MRANLRKTERNKENVRIRERPCVQKTQEIGKTESQG